MDVELVLHLVTSVLIEGMTKRQGEDSKDGWSLVIRQVLVGRGLPEFPP